MFCKGQFAWTRAALNGDKGLSSRSDRGFTSFNDVLDDAKLHGFRAHAGEVIEFVRVSRKPRNH